MNAIRKRETRRIHPSRTLSMLFAWPRAHFVSRRERQSKRTARDENAKSNSLCKRILRNSRSDPNRFSPRSLLACIQLSFRGDSAMFCNAIVLLFFPERSFVQLASTLTPVSMRHSNEQRPNPLRPTMSRRTLFPSAENEHKGIAWCIESERRKDEANQKIKLNNNRRDFFAVCFPFARLSINVFGTT